MLHIEDSELVTALNEITPAPRVKGVHTTMAQKQMIQAAFSMLHAHTWNTSALVREYTDALLHYPALSNLGKNNISYQLRQFIANFDFKKMLGTKFWHLSEALIKTPLNTKPYRILGILKSMCDALDHDESGGCPFNLLGLLKRAKSEYNRLIENGVDMFTPETWDGAMENEVGSFMIEGDVYRLKSLDGFYQHVCVPEYANIFKKLMEVESGDSTTSKAQSLCSSVSDFELEHIKYRLQLCRDVSSTIWEMFFYKTCMRTLVTEASADALFTRFGPDGDLLEDTTVHLPLWAKQALNNDGGIAGDKTNLMHNILVAFELSAYEMYCTEMGIIIPAAIAAENSLNTQFDDRTELNTFNLDGILYNIIGVALRGSMGIVQISNFPYFSEGDCTQMQNKLARTFTYISLSEARSHGMKTEVVELKNNSSDGELHLLAPTLELFEIWRTIEYECVQPTLNDMKTVANFGSALFAKINCEILASSEFSNFYSLIYSALISDVKSELCTNEDLMDNIDVVAQAITEKFLEMYLNIALDQFVLSGIIYRFMTGAGSSNNIAFRLQVQMQGPLAFIGIPGSKAQEE